MDKKTVIGLLIVGAILFGFTFYNSQQDKKRREIQEQQRREAFVKDSIDRALYPEKYVVPSQEEELEARARYEEQQKQAALEGETLKVANLGQTLVDAQTGEEALYMIENDVMKVFVSSRGAQVSNVELKDYKRYAKDGNGDPLRLYKEGSAEFDMEFFIRRTYNYAQINTSEYLFTTEQPRTIILGDGEESKSLSMRLPVDDESGAYVEYVYTLRPGEYMVDFDINFVGMGSLTSSLTDLRFNWTATTLQNEKGFKNENNYTTVAYRYPDAKSIEQLTVSEGAKNDNVKTKLNWLSFKQQFFSTVFIAPESFSDAEFGFQTYKPDQGVVKDFAATLSVPFYPQQNVYDFQFYFGPNDYKVMKQYDLRMEKVIPLGGSWLGWINTGFVIPIFNWLSKYISSYGIIILILTIMIKLIILPLTYKSYMSSAKMRVLKPDIEEINARYPDKADAMKKQQATMALYKKAGASPMGGCLPMLIQFPILIAMFRFFPASIDLRGQSFLWAEDLSAYDSVLELPFNIPLYGSHISLFTLLMVLALFFYSKINYQQTASTGQPQMAGMKFMMVYFMPVMMLCWFNGYASGLTYYYMLSQLFTIAQMTGFRYFVNEDKLHAKLKANAAKADSQPKKKSKWQARYEEALHQQQQRQQQLQSGSSRVNQPKPQATKNQPPKKKRK